MRMAITAERTYQMLENQTLWDTATRVHELFAARSIEHAVVGGVAVCLHGYRRNTVDLDLLIRPEDSAAVRTALETDGFEWRAKEKEFFTASEIAVQFVMAGERDGPGPRLNAAWAHAAAMRSGQHRAAFVAPPVEGGPARRSGGRSRR